MEKKMENKWLGKMTNIQYILSFVFSLVFAYLACVANCKSLTLLHVHPPHSKV